MKEILKLGVTLLIISGISATILGFTNEKTLPIIQSMTEKSNDEARMNVVPNATDFEKMDIDVDSDIIKEVYEGKDENEIVGYAIKTAPKGYAGAVEVMVGISKDGIVNGISIGNHSETPGLGSKAAEPAFKDQFSGKNAKEFNVIKGQSSDDSEIAAIAGATITSKGVTSGVNEAVKLYNNVLSK